MDNTLQFGLIILLILSPFIIRFIINLLIVSDNVNINELDNNIKEVTKINNTNNVNHLRIVSAGKNIKSIVYISLLMFILSMIIIILIFNNRSLKIVQTLYFILILVILLSNVLILIKVYKVGDELEKVLD